MKQNFKAAHFEQVKEQNKQVIRNLLRGVGCCGKKELADAAGLSVPTISALLRELADSGEVLDGQQLPSSGGRPAASFQLNPQYCYALCGFIDCQQIKLVVYDTMLRPCLDILPEGFRWDHDVPGQFSCDLWSEITCEELADLIEAVLACYPKITDLALGIPGVILDGIATYLPIYPKLEHQKLKNYLTQRLSLHVILENDVNSIAVAQKDHWPNMMHIIIDGGCIGSAILENGVLIRGAHGGAGELEMIWDSTMDNDEGLLYLIKLLQSILDLPVIVFSGNTLTHQRIRSLRQKLDSAIPKERIPEIYYVEDEIKLYQKGLCDMVLGKWTSL